MAIRGALKKNKKNVTNVTLGLNPPHPAQAAESHVESAMTLHSWLYIWAFSSGHQNKEEKFDTKADL